MEEPTPLGYERPLRDVLADLRTSLATGNVEGAKVYRNLMLELVGRLGARLGSGSSDLETILAAQQLLQERGVADMTPEFLTSLETQLAPVTAVTPPSGDDPRVVAAIAILDQDWPAWDDRWGEQAKEALEALRGPR